MKKIIYLISALLLIITTNTYALIFSDGPYFGGQIGWGRINEGDGYKHLVNNQSSPKVDLGTFTAWRVYAGYNPIPFFSIEAGYSHFPENDYKSASGNIKSDTYGIDIVGKIIIPLKILIIKPISYFSIYGKAGGIYLNTKIEDNINSRHIKTASIRPTYGAGLIFNFTKNIAIDASWTGGTGKTRVNSITEATNGNPVPNFNMYTLGISYKITGIL